MIEIKILIVQNKTFFVSLKGNGTILFECSKPELLIRMFRRVHSLKKLTDVSSMLIHSENFILKCCSGFFFNPKKHWNSQTVLLFDWMRSGWALAQRHWRKPLDEMRAAILWIFEEVSVWPYRSLCGENEIFAFWYSSGQLVTRIADWSCFFKKIVL